MNILPDAFFSFFLACVIIELTPGPNMTYLAGLSSIHGRKAGFSMAVGIGSGLLVLGLIATFGAAALILEHPAIYHALRWAGVCYMVWLAWENWRAVDLSQKITSGFDIRYFRRGFITNVLNPKAMIFYLTIFPTFINPEGSVRTQYMAMTVIYVVIATSVHCLIAILGDKLHPFFANPKRVMATRHFFSFLLLAIAIWFAYSTQLQVTQ